MFGLFKKNKLLKEVAHDLEEISKTLLVIPNNSETFKKIEQELKESGAPQEMIDNAWPLTVANAILYVAEKEIDFIYKNFNVRQASFYCISSYITNLYNNGSLERYKTEQPEMYSALQLFWLFCGEATKNVEFHKCIMVPEDNPFPD